MGKLVLPSKEIDVEPGVTIEEAILSNGMHPDSYLYLMDGKPVPMDTVIGADMKVKVMRVASGG